MRLWMAEVGRTPEPFKVRGHRDRIPAERRPGLFVGCLEKRQIGELLDVVAVRVPVITKNVQYDQSLRTRVCGEFIVRIP